MKGRPRKPTALKELQGNAGHRSDDGKAELTLPAGTPTPPEFLSPGARQEWFRLVGELSKVHGLLSPTDAAAIGIYCSYYDQWQQAEQDLPEFKKRLIDIELELAVLRSKRIGLKKREATIILLQMEELNVQYGRTLNSQNLALGDRNKARRELRAYLSELGLSPAARARIRVPTGQLDLPGMGEKTESAFERSQRLAGA